MKQYIRNCIKSVLPSFMYAYARHQVRLGFPVLKKGRFALLKDLYEYKSQYHVMPDKRTDFLSISRYQSSIIDNVKPDIDSYYIYPFDSHLIRVPKGIEIASLTPDYSYVLEFSLNAIADRLSGNTEFERGMRILIKSIGSLGDRIQSLLGSSNNGRRKELSQMFPDLWYRPANSLDEALQKILFYNALLWQNRLWHNGLGRLDKILYPYYVQDLSIGVLTREEAKKKLRHFLLLLNRDMEAKSYSLLGDTGQVILLGGIDKTGHDVSNELTEIFFELFAGLRLPDPKLILRVNDQTPEQIWKLSAECLVTGCGSPLLMNEELIMPLMERFGYAHEDCSEMGTSSCWEPLIIGKSFDQNNPVASIVPLIPIPQILRCEYTTFDELLNDYLTRLKDMIRKRTSTIQFDKSPILSLLYESCIEKKQDISNGGAIYYFHGMQVVGLPNAINSLLNIKEFVFDKRVLSLGTCADMLRHNYEGYDDYRLLFLGNSLKFGVSDPMVIDLTNKVTSSISEAISDVRMNGNPVKVGFSSPSYIGKARKCPASLDGRKYGEPFATHISPVSQDIDLPKILRFAETLDYSGNRLNGNVVDFTIPDAFRTHTNQLISLLKDSIKKGVYEIQLNVLDVESLKDARLHPEKYPYLVVRVWGFSAYFNDLPDEFKDNLIRRAEAYAS